MNNSILEKIKSIICDVLDDNVNINEETKAADVDGWDSLANITILASIQDEFGIRLTTEEVKNIHNVGDLVILVENKTK